MKPRSGQSEVALRATTPRGTSVMEQVEAQVRRSPHAIALSAHDGQLSYGELWARARALAHGLAAQLCADRAFGARRLLLHVAKDSAGYTALLAAFCAGAEVVPLDAALPAERKRLLAERSGARWLWDVASGFPEGACQKLAPTALEHAIEQAVPAPSEAAYIVFTSGSTGLPKAVLGAHGPLARFVAWYGGDILALRATDRVAQLSSLGLDAALADVFAAWTRGATLCIPQAEPYLYPARTVAWMKGERISVVKAVPGVVASWLTEPAAGLTLRLVALAGEAVSGSLARGLHDWLAEPSARCVNLYGTTESAVLDCAHWLSREASVDPVPVGQPKPGRRVAICDAQGANVSEGERGEVCLDGDDLTLGYLHDDAARRFGFAADGQRRYRTGDLGYVRDGVLFIVGRLDDELKLHGVRLHPREVERALEGHETVERACVAYASERKRLYAFVVPTAQGEIDPRALRVFLLERLPTACIPDTFLQVSELPRQPRSGKLDRARLLAEAMSAPEADPQPLTYDERRVAAAMASLLGRPIHRTDLTFFEAGGHSLLATRLVQRLAEDSGIVLELRDVFTDPSVGGLARALAAARTAAEGRSPGLPARIATGVPVSLAPEQVRLWLTYQREPHHAGYNSNVRLRLEGPFSGAHVASALLAVMDAHGALRTTFIAGDHPQLVEREAATLPFNELDLRELDAAQRMATTEAALRATALEPFVLEGELAWRALLVQTGDTSGELLLVAHHILFDASAWSVWLDDLGRALRGEPLEAEAVRYVEYAHWAAEQAPSESAHVYWRSRLADAPEPTALAAREAPLTASETVQLVVPAELGERLERLARQLETTPYVIWLSVFACVLGRTAGDLDEVLIASDASDRPWVSLDRCLGFFVRTLLLRLSLTSAASFAELVRGARAHMLEAHAHRALPFEQVSALTPHARGFRSMFVAPPPVITPVGPAGLRLTLAPSLPTQPKCDLTCTLRERDGQQQLTLEYAVTRLEREAVSVFGERMLAVARAAADAPESTLAALFGGLASLGRSASSSRICDDFDVGLRIRAQAASRPSACAISWSGGRLSYGELARRMDTCVDVLGTAGVKAGHVVALDAQRDGYGLAAFLALHELGAVVMPLERALPLPRREHMLSIVRPDVILIDEESVLANTALPQLPLPRAETGRRAKKTLPQGHELPADASCIFFTSGTTGEPKAVVTSRKALARFVAHELVLLEVQAHDVFALLTSFSFDAVLRDVFTPLCAGASVHLTEQMSATSTVEAIRAARASVVHTVPSVVASWAEVPLEHALPSLRALVLAGEPVTSSLVDGLRARWQDPPRIWNAYGATEATMVQSLYEVPTPCPPGVQSLGRGMAGAQLQVVGGDGQPRGPYELGELEVLTDWPSLGYLEGGALRRTHLTPTDHPGWVRYRTGDLGYLDARGHAQLTGRRDDQLKIRGVRVHPSEVSQRLREHAALSDSVVLGRREPTPELCAFAVLKPGQRATPSDLRAFLLERLPPSHVPSRIVLLPELPRLAHGKLDRPALWQLLETPVQVEASPFSEEERRVAEVWSQVLRRPLETLSPDSDFFAVGGHSLLALSLTHALSRTLGATLSLRALFAAPSIRGVTRALQRTEPAQLVITATARPSSLVPLRSGGDRAPWLLLHPLGGDVGCYVSLGRLLSARRAVWAAAAPGLEADEHPERSVRSLAERYLRDLEAASGHGPVRLLGWSFGGMIAYELAAQLERHGRPAQALVLIDSYAPGSSATDPTRSEPAARLRADLAALSSLGVTAYSAADEQRRLRVLRAHQRAAHEYRAVPLRATRTLFLNAAEQARPCALSATLGWDTHVETVMHVRHVAADHYSWLRPPVLQQVADLVEAWSDEVEPGALGARS